MKQCSCGGNALKKTKSLNIGKLRHECKTKGLVQKRTDTKRDLLIRLGRPDEPLKVFIWVCKGCQRVVHRQPVED